MIYLDSSAVMKLVRREPETPDLRQWLGQNTEMAWVTSELGRVEVLRAALRRGATALTVARGVPAELDLVALDREVQDHACDIGGRLLRTLDALHLASAMVLGDALHCFVAYDLRSADAARRIGLTVSAPGA